MLSTFTVSSWIQDVFQLIFVIVIFGLVLVATYFTTRFIGKSGLVQMHSKNIEVFETFKIAPNKYIQIIRIGSKYYAISVSKDSIHYLMELSEEQLVMDESKKEPQISFKDIMEKISFKTKKNK